MVTWTAFSPYDERTWPLAGVRLLVRVACPRVPDGFCMYAWRLHDNFVPALYPKTHIRRREIIAWAYAPVRVFEVKSE